MVNEISKSALAPLQPAPKPSEAQPAQPQPSQPVSGTGSVASLQPAQNVERSAQAESESENSATDLAQNLQNFAQSLNRSITFNVNQDSGDVVILVTEAETGKTIREIPSREVQALRQNLAEVIERLETTSKAVESGGVIINSIA